MSADNGSVKVVLITGGSSGIGAEAAHLFAKKGYRVAVAGSNRERVDKVVNECDNLSPTAQKAFGIVADLSDINNGAAIVEKTIGHYNSLHVLVNNVGIYSKTNSCDKSTFDTYRQMMTINVDSVVKTTQEAVPYIQRSGGNIVFVSSVASVKPSKDGYAYRMSKAALSSFAKCLACDLAPQVRVNIVSPGPISTPLFAKNGISEEQLQTRLGPTTLLNRAGKSEEVANVIYFLASDEASYVNGAEWFVDGGSTIKYH